MEGAREFERVTAMMFAQAGDVVLSDFIPYMAFLTKLQGKPKLYRKTREIVLEMMRSVTNFDDRKKIHKEGRSTGKPEDFVDVLLNSTLADGETPLPDDICLLLVMVRIFLPNQSNSLILVPPFSAFQLLVILKVKLEIS